MSSFDSTQMLSVLESKIRRLLKSTNSHRVSVVAYSPLALKEACGLCPSGAVIIG